MKFITFFYFSLALLVPLSLYGDPASRNPQIYSYGPYRLFYDNDIALVHHTNMKRAYYIYKSTTNLPIEQRTEDGVSYRILSIAGPVISYAADSYLKGGAHASYGRSYRTYDLNTKKSASLLTYFPEKELLRAFLEDPVLKKKLPAGKKIESLEDFFKNADGKCEMYIDKNMLSHFAFHHINNNRVAVRIGLGYGCGANRGDFTQIGIYLNIPKSLRSELNRAKIEGRLMSDL